MELRQARQHYVPGTTAHSRHVLKRHLANSRNETRADRDVTAVPREYGHVDRARAGVEDLAGVVRMAEAVGVRILRLTVHGPVVRVGSALRAADRGHHHLVPLAHEVVRGAHEVRRQLGRRVPDHLADVALGVLNRSARRVVPLLPNVVAIDVVVEVVGEPEVAIARGRRAVVGVALEAEVPVAIEARVVPVRRLVLVPRADLQEARAHVDRDRRAARRVRVGGETEVGRLAGELIRDRAG